jgi:hypothetical protein
VEEALGLEAEVFITGGQRNPPQGSDFGDTNLSVILLPHALYMEINKHMSNFWWGQKANNSQIH